MLKFELSDAEEETAKKWICEHTKTCADAKQRTERTLRETVASSGFVYMFQHTSIATAITVKCVCCNEEKDVTDW